MKNRPEKRPGFSDYFRNDLGSIWTRFVINFLLEKPIEINVRIDTLLNNYVLWNFIEKELVRCSIPHVEICIFIWFLQCFWTIRSLRTCVNFDIEARLDYLNFQLKHLSKNVPKSMSETSTNLIPISTIFFIDFGSPNPSNSSPKSVKNRLEI